MAEIIDTSSQFEFKFFILDGVARPIFEEAVFRGMFGNDVSKAADHLTNNPAGHKHGPPIYQRPPLVRTSNGKVYLLDEEKKRWIQDPETFSYYGFDWNSVVNTDEYQDWADGEAIKI